MTATKPPGTEPRPTVLVDAENVRRSIWPNISKDELITLTEDWARENGVDARVVFEPKDETADE